MYFCIDPQDRERNYCEDRWSQRGVELVEEGARPSPSACEVEKLFVLVFCETVIRGLTEPLEHKTICSSLKKGNRQTVQ